MREKLIELLGNVYLPMTCGPDAIGEYRIPHKFKKEIADHLIANGVVVLPLGGIGEMSDGYHTFNELYHHRAVLFSTICNARPDLAWKSKLHDTGDMYEGMFIVGIETKEGQATYHYDIDPYWDMFSVPVLDRAPVWDGHTPQQAIDRIASVKMERERFWLKENGEIIPMSRRWMPVTERLPQVREVQWDDLWYLESDLVLGFGGDGMAVVKRTQEIGADRWLWIDIDGNAWPVTHWMPLPAPPKGE